MDKYALYELFVQSPQAHLEWFSAWFEQIHGKPAVHLREDFCGTFQICCEWVKRGLNHTAVGFDIDLKPLMYGQKHHLKKLTAEQKERIWIQQQNVLASTVLRADMILACNFSFCIFQTRTLLLEYFKKAYQGLFSSGSLILELAGGPGMVESVKETRTKTIKGKKYRYVWDQKDFDPIHNQGLYAIHFRLPSGQMKKNAFVYDWRLWTIPEVTELLLEAGFNETVVYWETAHQGEGTGEYAPTLHADNAHAWVSYLCANKKS